MTKKKRGHPDIGEILERPWCYYCERDFDDLKILINHQKAKHFKCERCGRRLNTAGGLSVHMSQVHKENLSAVDNALPNRAGLDIEIFGMEGIPEDIVQQHNQRVVTSFHQAEAERRAQSGSIAGGVGAAGAQPKKPKFESPAELKQRLAEHKAAKLAAEATNGGSSGGGTPVGAGQSQPPTILQNPNTYASKSQFPPYQQPFNGAPSGAAYSQPQPYAQPPAPSSMPYHPPQPYAQPPTQGSPFQQPSQQQQPGGYSFQPSFPPPHHNHAQHAYQRHSPTVPQNGQPPFPGVPGGPPRPYGAASPAQPYHPQQQIAPRIHTPPQAGGFPPRPPSLPNAPGLPQRPAFGAPQVNAFQLQQMHQGQIPPSLPMPPMGAAPPRQDVAHSSTQQPSQILPTSQQAPPSQESANATSLDDLISVASKEAARAASQVSAAPIPAATASTSSAPGLLATSEVSEEKASKKEKEKNKATRLIYSDNNISPEEKMARMPRYAFTPEWKAAMA